MSPASGVARRLSLYAATLTVYLIAFSFASRFMIGAQILGLVRTPAGALIIVLVHLLLGGGCFWMRWKGRHQLAWLTVVAPNALLIVGLVIFCRMLIAPGNSLEDIIFACAASIVWTACLWLAIHVTRRTPVDAQELDFSIEMAGLTNGFALMMVPFEMLVNL